MALYVNPTGKARRHWEARVAMEEPAALKGQQCQHPPPSRPTRPQGPMDIPFRKYRRSTPRSTISIAPPATEVTAGRTKRMRVPGAILGRIRPVPAAGGRKTTTTQVNEWQKAQQEKTANNNKQSHENTAARC